jgi:hypothetical protein
MSSSLPRSAARVRDVTVTDDEVCVSLVDGRKVSAPLAWFPRLLHATPAQRAQWSLLGDGEGIHWPSIDEDISVFGLLRGEAVPEGGSKKAAPSR